MPKRSLKDYASLSLKGLGMGAANVIPGVSGGTIALITGIFEELIDSIKSFDLKALQLLIRGKFLEFARHVNLSFLVAVFLGVAVSILSLAKLLDYLFMNYPVYVWAFFFGLILASVYFVGRSVHRWNLPVIVSLVVGTGVAVAISVLNPASENDHFLYLLICGVVAVCSMILPGLSGSFVLILLGNYELVMIKAVSHLRFDILLPVVLGAGGGLILFSHFLSWVFKKFRNETISLLTGFILGSLAILWPWKYAVYKLDAAGQVVTRSSGEMIITGYQRFIPDAVNKEVILAIAYALMGIVVIWLIEKYAGTIQEEEA
jgi:putative membrane protein